MRVFITGITGTLGTALAKYHHSQGDKVWGCARNEAKAVEWLWSHHTIANLFVGDARLFNHNQSDIARLLPHIDKVYHCAAMKHIDTCERQPVEALAENVTLTNLVACVCSKLQIPMVFISSDKACLPQGVYGATKLLAERVAIKEGAAVVRFGNIIGSSGSVFHIWKNQPSGDPIKVTDCRMTRYFIDVKDAAYFAVNHAINGRVTIPSTMRSVEMGEAAREFSGLKSAKIVETGAREGETLHQWLIAPKEPYTDHKYALEIHENGDTEHSGLCSHTASRWDIKELMEIINE